MQLLDTADPASKSVIQFVDTTQEPYKTFMRDVADKVKIVNGEFVTETRIDKAAAIRYKKYRPFDLVRDGQGRISVYIDQDLLKNGSQLVTVVTHELQEAAYFASKIGQDLSDSNLLNRLVNFSHNQATEAEGFATRVMPNELPPSSPP